MFFWLQHLDTSHNGLKISVIIETPKIDSFESINQQRVAYAFPTCDSDIFPVIIIWDNNNIF